eukprot:5319639-Prymnesium_polylepis.3
MVRSDRLKITKSTLTVIPPGDVIVKARPACEKKKPNPKRGLRSPTPPLRAARASVTERQPTRQSCAVRQPVTPQTRKAASATPRARLRATCTARQRAVCQNANQN